MIINQFGTYTHTCTATWLVESRVESKKTGNCKLADGGRDHNPRREAAYGNSNIPSKQLFMFKTGTQLLCITITINYQMECLQHERVRISQNKTSIECQSFIRICRLDTELITCGGSSRYSQLQCLRVALLAEVQARWAHNRPCVAKVWFESTSQLYHGKLNYDRR